jgi:FkbM family methyltransferase
VPSSEVILGCYRDTRHSIENGYRAGGVTDGLKQALKRIVPERQWQQLSRLKGKLNFETLCERYISSLPTERAFSMKAHLKRIGRLDYPHHDIYMNLDSPVQLNRLGSCKKEPETVEWIEAHMRSGDVLYDIGANIGAYSFVAHAATNGECKVYAFEPGFTTFAALSQNVLLNRCQEKIIPLHVALAHETKLLAFNYSSIAPGAATHQLGGPTGNKEQTFKPVFTQPILSYRLDDLVSQFVLQPANHIKIDVDGAELSVLCGAEKTLAQPNLHSLLIEVDEELHPNGEIPALLINKGFRVKSKHPRLETTTVFNYVFER